MRPYVFLHFSSKKVWNSRRNKQIEIVTKECIFTRRPWLHGWCIFSFVKLRIQLKADRIYQGSISQTFYERLFGIKVILRSFFYSQFDFVIFGKRISAQKLLVKWWGKLTPGVSFTNFLVKIKNHSKVIILQYSVSPKKFTQLYP